MSKIYKLVVFIAVAFLFLQARLQAQNFITKWSFADAPSTEITFYAVTAGAVNYTWTASPSGHTGSGSFTGTAGILVTLTGLTIDAGDVVTLSMEPANLRRFYNLYAVQNPMAWRIIDVTQWGAVPWTNMTSAFAYCKFLNITATDIPDLSAVTLYDNMFYQCEIMTGPPNINSWDVSHATSMINMFAFAHLFNQPLASWQVHNVKKMRYMFYATHLFNQPLNTWDVSGVLELNNMFNAAVGFNQPLDNWNVSGATSLEGMFRGASAFNQNIGSWTLNSSVDMANMLTNNGMDCSIYSATLKGWHDNNPAVTGRTLGADGRKYTLTIGAAERDELVTTRAWTINGDAPVTATAPWLVPVNTSITGVDACDAPYVNPANKNQKILQIVANGNSFTHASATVTVSNSSMGYDAGGLIGYYINAATQTGYSQMANGTNTLRVSHRMHTIQMPGSYSVNGGVLVRVYYRPADISTITGNSTVGNPIMKFGWFKSTKHSALEVLQDMNYSTMKLNNAVEISPVTTGTEGTVSYAEFLLESFSTIGYYAGTLPIVLPVKLSYFTGVTEGCAVRIQWKSELEEDFSRYEIERAAGDAEPVFIKIGELAGSGHTFGSTYSFRDENVTEGIRYIYRLKMIDKDGKYSYSKNISVNPDCRSLITLSVFPNPAKNQITVRLPQPGGMLGIYTADGKQWRLYKTTGTIEVVDLSAMPKGIYLVRYITEREATTVKLVRE